MLDIEEEEKEDALCKHSEKVTLAFGLISLKGSMPMRIVKNLGFVGIVMMLLQR